MQKKLFIAFFYRHLYLMDVQQKLMADKDA